MTAVQRTASGRPPGWVTMLAVTTRVQWRAALVWVLVLGAGMVGTAAGVAALYDTAAKIHSYAAAVTTGSALAAINGKVVGIDSLGGVIQDEFGFLAAFALPLLGIALVARATRREEESGRLELLLGGRIARRDPVLAALLLATATIAVTIGCFALGLLAFGVPLSGAVLYALSLGALAFGFATVAALLSQLTVHARGVYSGALLVLAASYLLRGVGDTTGTWVSWLSPLGWAEKTAPFGDQRWWVLAVPVLVGLTLAGAALMIAARRDLGSALFRAGAGPARAGDRLRHPIGFAVLVHRPAVLGWLAGGVLLTAMMGILSRQLRDAMQANPALAQVFGSTHGRLLDGLVAVTQLYLAVIASGYVIAALGTLRAEEAQGRLETRLSGTLSRSRWLGAHALVVLGGLVVIVLGSSLVLAVTTAASVGDAAEIVPILTAAPAYLPAELVLAGLALAIFGLRPQVFVLAWAGFAAVAFIALLGRGLRLPQWILGLAPTSHVGSPPLSGVPAVSLVVMAVVAASLVAVGFAAFRRRGIPQA